MEFVIPLEHLLLGIVLSLLSVDSSMSVSDIKPEVILIICEIILLVYLSPVVWKPLESCTLNWCESPYYVMSDLLLNRNNKIIS